MYSSVIWKDREIHNETLVHTSDDDMFSVQNCFMRCDSESSILISESLSLDVFVVKSEKKSVFVSHGLYLHAFSKP